MKEVVAKVVLLAATLVGVALAATACGPVVPEAPTWKDDVRPLLVSRCIRCHSASFRTDPSVKVVGFPTVDPATPSLFNFDFPTFTDIPAGNRGILKLAGQYCRTKGLLFMPPPPAEALEDWQIEILDRWAVNPQ